MNTKPTRAGGGPKVDPPRPATARPLGIADIPGAIHPDEAARRGDAGASNRGAGPGQRPGGMGGGGMGGGGMGGGGMGGGGMGWRYGWRWYGWWRHGWRRSD